MYTYNMSSCFFPCVVCGRKYTRKDNLVRHMKIHDENNMSQANSHEMFGKCDSNVGGMIGSEERTVNHPDSFTPQKTPRMLRKVLIEKGPGFHKFALVPDDGSSKNLQQVETCTNPVWSNSPLERASEIDSNTIPVGFGGVQEKLTQAVSSEQNGLRLPSSFTHPIDQEISSVMINPKLCERERFRQYLQTVRKHLCPKRAALEDSQSTSSYTGEQNKRLKWCDYVSTNEDEYGESDEQESDTESEHEDTESLEEDQQQLHGGHLIDSDSEGYPTEDETYESPHGISSDAVSTDNETDSQSNETDNLDEVEEEMFEECIITWPPNKQELPWQSHGQEILLWDQLPWLKRIATSQSTAILLREMIRISETQVSVLCEIASNLLIGNIPFTSEEFDLFKKERDGLRYLANENDDWKRKRWFLGSQSGARLLWCLLIAVEPLYETI